MRERAFKILGVEAGASQDDIRQAFLRLAHIYHPDRFAGMGDEVREEAERRMKDATAAYRLLRTPQTPVDSGPPPPSSRGSNDPWEDARLWREAIAARQHEDAQDAERWKRWDQLERQARERAEWEAQLAARLAQDLGPTVRPNGSVHENAPSAGEPADDEPVSKAPRPKSLLQQRLDQARGDAATPRESTS
jgi:curved DNA-binding protein CbpA